MAQEFTRLQSLITAVEHSRRRLEVFRRNRADILREYVGRHYSDDGTREPVPVNMIRLAVNIYTQQLVARNPSSLVLPDSRQLKAQATDLQDALNAVIQEIDLEKPLRTAVIEAMFSLGVVKVGVTPVAEVEWDGHLHEAGLPFCDPVPLDDYVMDMRVSRPEQRAYVGDRRRVRFRDVVDNEEYDREARKKVTPQDDREAGGYTDESDRTEHIGQGASYHDEEFVEYTNVWDVWLPRDRLVVTYSEQGSAERPLKVKEWTGPRRGMYHELGFHEVVTNLMPLPPASDWVDLHLATNSLFTKLIEQANDAKTVLAVNGHAREDGSRVVKARNGEAVLCNNVDGMKEMRFNGPDQQLIQFAMMIKQLASYMAGNLDVQGGLSTQAETLGQEEILRQSSSQVIQSMQHSVKRWVRGIVHDIAWWLWNEPFLQVPLVRRVPGTDLELETGWPYQMEEGPFGHPAEVDVRERASFSDFNFDILPFSMNELPPQQRVQLLREIWHRDVLPTIGMDPGVVPNLGAYLKLLGDYNNLPELQEIVTVSGLEEQPRMEQPRQPAHTQREYVRHNRGGAADLETQMMHMMPGGGQEGAG